jgi:uncharacterized protein YdbL (DUF1318 family)
MKRIGNIVIFLLAGTLLFPTVGSVWAQGIKERMHARLPEIAALKSKGIVGENNQGYLTILQPSSSAETTITAENQDRRTIYTAIAKKQGTTTELVGRRRALQIAKKAASGTMIQGADGKWGQK